MKTIHSLCCATALVGAIAFAGTPADAQSSRPAPRRAPSVRVPDTGMTAVGLTAGVAMPTADNLDTGTTLAAGIEHYLAPRVSVRGQIEGAWQDIHGHSFTGTVKPFALTGNVLYNWEGGKIHPYVTAGLGLYHFRFAEADVDSSDNHFGVNLGGGVEYFISGRDAITGELQAHVVSGTATGALATYHPSYWTLAFGYKKYWR